MGAGRSQQASGPPETGARACLPQLLGLPLPGEGAGFPLAVRQSPAWNAPEEGSGVVLANTIQAFSDGRGLHSLG